MKEYVFSHSEEIVCAHKWSVLGGRHRKLIHHHGQWNDIHATPFLSF